MPMVADLVDTVVGGDTHKDTHTLQIATPSGVPLAALVIGNDGAGYAARWPGSRSTRPAGGWWWAWRAPAATASGWPGPCGRRV